MENNYAMAVSQITGKELGMMDGKLIYLDTKEEVPKEIIEKAKVKAMESKEKEFKQTLKNYSSELLNSGIKVIGGIQKCDHLSMAILNSQIGYLDDNTNRSIKWYFNDDEFIENATAGELKLIRNSMMEWINSIKDIEVEEIKNLTFTLTLEDFENKVKKRWLKNIETK